MSKAPEGPKLRRISWLIWAGLGILVLLLFSAFSRAWTLNRALRQKEALLIPMLEEQEARQATLEAELTYVQSDEAARDWSQSDAGMTQPEETLVILMATPTSTVTPVPPPTPTPTLPPFWIQWWQAITGR